MQEVDPETALTAAESERKRRRERAVDALEWFRDRAGLVSRTEAVSALADAHDWSDAQSNRAIGDVVGDLVDPVQQVVHPERGKLVGIIEYHENPDSGCYGYVDYDDMVGRRKRVVCSECVSQADSDAEVAHATEGEGTAPAEATWEALVTTVEDHYETEHDVEPSEVEVGASLASGTTISGNTVFHKGNDGEGSSLDADLVRGQSPSSFGGVTVSSSSPSAPEEGNQWYDQPPGFLRVYADTAGGLQWSSSTTAVEIQRDDSFKTAELSGALRGYDRAIRNSDGFNFPPNGGEILSDFPEGTQAVTFAAGGRFIYTTDPGSNDINQFQLPARYELKGGAQKVGSFDPFSEDDNPAAVDFSESGDTMVMVGQDTSNVFGYDLSTPFDVETATLTSSAGLSLPNRDPQDVQLVGSGNTLLVAASGGDADIIQSYPLRSPNDVSNPQSPTEDFYDVAGKNILSINVFGSLDMIVNYGEFNSTDGEIELYKFNLPFVADRTSLEQTGGFPSKNLERMVLAVSPDGGTVLGQEAFGQSVGYDQFIPDTYPASAIYRWDTLPFKLGSWVDFGYGAELNGGGLEVDIVDESGATLLSDVGRNVDVSSIPPTEDFGVRITMTGGPSANPKVTSLYRRYTKR